jgi:hypothetical protein
VNEVCYQEGHLWRGTGACVYCGEQLRCFCGRFVREDGIEKHLNESCPLASLQEREDDHHAIEAQPA